MNRSRFSHKPNFSDNAKSFKNFMDLASTAAEMVGTASEQMQAIARSKLDLFMTDLNLVSREEFDVLEDMLKKSRTEQEELKKRLHALETMLKTSAAQSAVAKTKSQKSTPKKSAKKTKGKK
jgi:BMFP domain-containing protein YqiC